jgi:hypothetical protein
MANTGATKTLTKLDQLRINLAHDLGFADYPESDVAGPFLNYIENRYIGGPKSLEDYLNLFRNVVNHFVKAHLPQPSQPPSSGSGHATSKTALDSDSIQAYITTLSGSNSEPIFTDTRPGTDLREELVTDTVLYVIGVWTAMLSCFVKLPSGYRQVELAYCIKQGKQVGTGQDVALKDTSLPGLLKGSGLLPSPMDGYSSAHSNQNGLVDVARLLLSSIPFNGGSAGNSLSDSSANQKLKTALASYISSSACATSFYLPDSLSSSSTVAAPSTYPTSPLLLHASVDTLESASIKSTALNAYTLSSLAGVRIHWTFNLSRHFLLSSHAGHTVLEVFALPCILQGGAKSLQATGVPVDLIHEIKESYSILFNPSGAPSIHSQIGRVFWLRRWCWCQSCSLRRLRDREIQTLKRRTSPPISRAAKRTSYKAKSEFDPNLVELIADPDPDNWNHDLFPYLWPRIVALEEHLHAAKPWSFWVLFRDRRDTLQFWTFL